MLRRKGLEPLSRRGSVLGVALVALWLLPEKWTPDSAFFVWCKFVGTLCAMIVYYYWRRDVIDAEDTETAEQLATVRRAGSTVPSN